MINKIPKKTLVLFIGDVLIISASIYFAPFLRSGIVSDPSSIFGLSNLVPVFVYVFTFFLFDMYNIPIDIERFSLALKLTLVIFAINIINASLFYLLHLRLYSSWILFISGLLSTIFLLIWRFLFIYLAHKKMSYPRVCILGAGNTGRALYDSLKKHPDYFVIGFIDDDSNKQGIFIDDLPVLGKSDNLMGIITDYNIQKIIVCINGKIRPEVFPQLVEAKFRGVTIYEMPTFYEKIAGKIPVLHTSNIWLGYANIYGVENNLYNSKIKNVIDKLLAIMVIVITLPIIILTAALIKLDSKGPVFYRQKRVGYDGIIFSLGKFRSMIDDAENNGAVWTQRNDSRVTRIGKIIRKFRTDEIPQIWNVLKGDMSFVGPRPERPEFVNSLQNEIPYYMLRHSVKPGITGWAQVNYKYGDSLDDAREKLQYDLYYIKNKSFVLDFYIMLKTLQVILFGLGAR
jgi:sugar transferase (PEP-CTERM system associated)